MSQCVGMFYRGPARLTELITNQSSDQPCSIVLYGLLKRVQRHLRYAALNQIISFYNLSKSGARI
jgi:hypothetical protein